MREAVSIVLRLRASAVVLVAVALAGATISSGLLASAAQAQQRGAVLEFSGRGAAAVRAEVVSALTEELELVPRADVEDAAESAGVDIASPQGMADVAQSLSISIFVRGSVSGRRRRARASIEFLDAQGQPLSSLERRAPRGRSGRNAFERAVRDAFAQASEELNRRAEEQRGEELAEERQELEELRSDDVLDDEEGDEEEGSGAPGGPAMFEARLGITGRTRDAKITFENGASRDYNIGVFPEVGIDLVLRPFASDESALRGLFLEAGAGLSVGLKTELDDAGMTELGSDTLRFNATVGYLAALGALEFGGGLGFSYDAFNIEDNAVMPSSQYLSLRPGLIGIIPLMGDLLHARLDLGLRVLLGGGDLDQIAESTSGLGFDVQAAVGGALDMGFSYQAFVGYTRYSLSFDGQGTSTTDIGKDGSDQAIRFGVSAGWAFR